MTSLHPNHLRRLDIQGFDTVPVNELAAVAPWLRMAYALCTALALVGTVLASVPLLLGLAVVAGLAALFPVHPFDLLYNHGIRHVTGTGPLPRRGAPGRFACALATAFLLVEAWAFSAGMMTLGYAVGGALVVVGGLVGTVDICIPSMIWRRLFGPPVERPMNAAPASRLNP